MAERIRRNFTDPTADPTEEKVIIVPTNRERQRQLFEDMRVHNRHYHDDDLIQQNVLSFINDGLTVSNDIQRERDNRAEFNFGYRPRQDPQLGRLRSIRHYGDSSVQMGVLTGESVQSAPQDDDPEQTLFYAEPTFSAFRDARTPSGMVFESDDLEERQPVYFIHDLDDYDPRSDNLYFVHSDSAARTLDNNIRTTADELMPLPLGAMSNIYAYAPSYHPMDQRLPNEQDLQQIQPEEENDSDDSVEV
jgi:hypothetical protein